MELPSLGHIVWSLIIFLLGIAIAELRNQGKFLFVRPAKRRYLGTATDLSIDRASKTDTSGTKSKLDLKGDFARHSATVYSYEDFRISFFGKKIFVRGAGIRRIPNRRDVTFTARGWGDYLLGDRKKGIIVSVLEVKCGSEVGRVAHILKYTDPATMRGYWISDNSQDPTSFGMLALGELTFEAKEIN